MNSVHDVIENINSCCSHCRFPKSKPLYPSFTIYMSIFSGICKQTVNKALQFMVIETSDSKDLSKKFIIIFFPLEYSILRALVIGPAYFDPIRYLDHWVLFFVHEPINESRRIFFTWHLHESFNQFHLKLCCISLIELFDEWPFTDLLCDILVSQLSYEIRTFCTNIGYMWILVGRVFSYNPWIWPALFVWLFWVLTILWI